MANDVYCLIMLYISILNGKHESELHNVFHYAIS